MAVMSSRWQAAKSLDVEGVAAELEAFVRERFEVAEDDPRFHRGTHLWEEGYVDSTGAVELITFLEDRYALTLPEDVLFDPAFTSIEGISRCVATLLGG
jgi:acyl carrier protein